MEENIQMGMNVTEKHRKVSLDVIIVGPNKRGTPQSRLIVPEENNRELVKEYTKKKDIYYCVACNRQGKFNYGKIEYNCFLTPTFHYSWCLPTSRIEAERKNFIKQSKTPGVCFARNINSGIRKQNKLSPAAKLNSAILDDIFFTEKTTANNEKRC
uniref:Uncharacterized protein n=1 Tax=Panagrolaimus sp. PS1159 TaxID=55785 RepID=A0AC35EWL6_9BILA